MKRVNSSEQKDKHRGEAKKRQDAHDNLTVEQKLAKLDAKLGAGIGAKKERAQLTKLLETK